MDVTLTRQDHINLSKKLAREYFGQHRLTVSYIHSKRANVTARPTKEDVKAIQALFSVYPSMTAKHYAAYYRSQNEGNEPSPEQLAVFRSVRSLVKQKSSPCRGLVATFDKNGQTLIGWSLCNISKGDTFRSEEGIRKAIKRAIPVAQMEQEMIRAVKVMNEPDPEKRKNNPPQIPHTCLPYLQDAIRKAKSRKQVAASY